MSLAIPRIWWPLTTTLPAVSFTATATAGEKTYTSALVASATYSTPEALATALAAALAAAVQDDDGVTLFTGDGGTVSGHITAAGRMTLTFAGTTSGDVSIAWSGSTTLGTLTGFGSTNTPPSAGLVLTAANQVTNLWTPDQPVTADTGSEFVSAISVVETGGGQNKTTRWTTLTRRTLRFDLLPAHKTRIEDETSSTTNEALENLWSGSGVAKFSYYPDRSNTSAKEDYFLLADTASEFRPERYSAALNRYSVELRMGAYNE